MSVQPNRRNAPSAPGGHSGQPPWQHSPALGGDFIYAPSTDEIYLKDGRRFRRPKSVAPKSLSSATYNGPLPPPTQPPQSPNIPTGSPPAPNQLSLQSGLPADFGQMTARGDPNPIAPRPVQVVFHTHPQSVIARREPLFPTSMDQAIAISNNKVTSTLFSTYKLQPDTFFKVGRVFLVLWSEPAGGGDSRVSKWEQGTVLNQFGAFVSSKIRRFVVIRSGGSYSSCIPINTYVGRGVSKRGVIKSEHAIVYTGQSAPLPKPDELPKRGETGIRSVPIQVDPDNPDERLHPASRIDFGGVTRVAHNIKVKSFGMVNKRSLPALQQQFDNVFHANPVVGPLGSREDRALERRAGSSPAKDDASESSDDEDDEESYELSTQDDDEDSEDEEDDEDDNKEHRTDADESQPSLVSSERAAK